MLNEENLKPSLKCVQINKAGIFTTFILLLISGIIGLFSATYFMGKWNTLTMPNIGQILVLIVPIGAILALALIIHIPLRKAIGQSMLIALSIFIINAIYFFTPGYGPKESPGVYTVVILLPLIIFISVAVLAAVGILFRLLINKLGTLGYFVCCFLTLLAIAIMSA